jgi:hypothetical protein|tara:strand:+ start:95 stop:658 length:564 start_codon:yes stop_codon:yes gene_type:complete
MFIVDDDFLPKSTIGDLKHLQGVPFLYNKSSCYKCRDYSLMNARGCAHDYPQFVHTLYSDGKKDSKNFEPVVAPIIKYFFEKNNISEKILTRAKVNMTTKCSKNLRTTPHIDNANKHYVMIYYVNDSDGDTIIYKQKYGEKRLWLSPYKRVSPKAGRCVFFNGLHYHSASLPKKSDVRCVVNMNFID